MTNAKKGRKAGTQVIRYSENPFLKTLEIKKGRKKVSVGLTASEDLVLIDQKTGEHQGTHLSTYKQVDQEEFVKIFTTNISMIFELDAAGTKALGVLFWVVQGASITKDVVALNALTYEDFMTENSNVKMSIPTFKRGLTGLEKAQIIAKARRVGDYFLNPNFCFNGNRIVFSQAIELKKKEGSSEKQEEIDFKER